MAKGYKDLLLKEVKELLKKLPPNVRIRVYYDGMGRSKYTLNQLGSKIDQIGEDLAKLTKYVTEGFKRVDERIDRIDARLDYIVKANNLKDSK